jgi:hypothetical protein
MSDPNNLTPDQNQSPNLFQQSGNFAADAAVDTTADGVVNQVVDGVLSHIPGAQGMEQMINTEVDQNVNNEINAELNKGVEGIMNDLGGLFKH